MEVAGGPAYFIVDEGWENTPKRVRRRFAPGAIRRDVSCFLAGRRARRSMACWSRPHRRACGISNHLSLLAPATGQLWRWEHQGAQVLALQPPKLGLYSEKL